MQVYTIVCENEDLVELNLGLTKQGRNLKRADKATKGSLKDEAQSMEVELLTYMKNSGNTTATPSLVKNYLNQKGLGTVGNPIVDAAAKASTKPGAVGMDNPRQEPPVSSGDAPVNPTGDTGAPAVGSPKAPEPLAPGTLAKTADGSEFKWLGNQWRDAKTGRMASKEKKAELNKAAPTESISEAEAEPTLSKRQVRGILKQVITKAYGDQAGFGKSKFASDTPGSRGNNDAADTTAMIDKLKAQGYKVTK
jgi:hypothetical protein